MNSVVAVQPHLDRGPIAAEEQRVNFGKIRGLSLERPKHGPKTITTDLWIYAPAQFVVFDEEMPFTLDYFVAHRSYRESGRW
jgi:hypothetical protein